MASESQKEVITKSPGLARVPGPRELERRVEELEEKVAPPKPV